MMLIGDVDVFFIMFVCVHFVIIIYDAGQVLLSNPAGRDKAALPGVSQSSVLYYYNQWWVGIQVPQNPSLAR